MVEISPKIKKVVGILFVTVCVIALIIVLIRRKNKRKDSEDNTGADNNDSQSGDENEEDEVNEEGEELDSDIKETYQERNEEPKPANLKSIDFADVP